MLIFLSVLTYLFKWQADTVLLGIIAVYILAGFIGGKVKKRFSYEMGIGKRLLDGILVGTCFMLTLSLLSLLLTEGGISLSGRLLVIWLLLIGSTSLGRL